MALSMYLIDNANICDIQRDFSTITDVNNNASCNNLNDKSRATSCALLSIVQLNMEFYRRAASYARVLVCEAQTSASLSTYICLFMFMCYYLLRSFSPPDFVFADSSRTIYRSARHAVPVARSYEPDRSVSNVHVEPSSDQLLDDRQLKLAVF